MTFKEYRAQYGAEAVAAELTHKLGKTITKKRVQSYGADSNPAPKAWMEALGLSDISEPVGTSDDPPAGTGSETPPPRSSRPPQPPEDAKLVFPKPELPAGSKAKQRIAAVHSTVGAGLAAYVDKDGFDQDKGVGGGVAALWQDRSADLAEAWIAWAAEGNRFANTVVNMMEAGGAGGDLVMGYAMLLFGTGYIMGRVPDNEITRTFYGRYSRYRTIPQQRPAPGQSEPEPRVEPGAEGVYADSGNGAVDAGAAGTLVDHPFPHLA